MSHIAVLGAGAWGIALASKLATNHKEVVIWGRNPNTVAQINNRLHPKHPGQRFATNIHASTDLDVVLSQSKSALLCVPSHAFISILEAIKTPPPFFAWATKGFSPTGRLFSEVIKEKLAIEGSFITGPSFAQEVVKNKPTAILVAGAEKQNTFWKKGLHSENFRPYTSEDIKGAQVGAALKNIIAIAVGICEGLALGSNAQAAVITRGLKEIEKLSGFFGGQTHTLYGLSGLGDVVLTSTSNQSRNRQYGLNLTQKRSFTELSEGAKAVAIVYQIMKTHTLDLPICESVYKITHQQRCPKEEVARLLTRALKAE